MIQLSKIKFTLFIQTFILLAGMLFNMSGVKGQNTDIITVKGNISDTTGNPLIGVTVMVVESSKGVLSDYNGNFSIDAKKGSTLRFSYLGFKSQEAPVAPEMNIRLVEDKVNLDEVVVVAIGYGTARKSDLTGAIASVSSEKLNRGIITTSEQLLQGKVAGLTVMRTGGDPSVGASVRLRGGTSLSGGNGPLYVIDGVPGADINSISPSDIDAIDVLKDASAAAIYGSRGANGVILVTTKKAKEGKSHAEYNGYAAIGNASKTYDLLSADQWRKYVRETPGMADKAIDYGANTDWQDEMLRTSYTQSHSLSVDGSSGSSSYRASANYLDNPGIVINSGLKRIGGSVNLKQKVLNDKLTIEGSLSNTFDNWNAVNYSAFSLAYNLNPTVPVIDQSGKYTYLGGSDNNPIAILKERHDRNTRQRFLGFAKFDLEILSSLKATVNLSHTLDDYNQNFYATLNDPYDGFSNHARAQKQNSKGTTSTLETYLNYDVKFGDNALNAMAGYSYAYSMYYGFAASRNGFDTDLFEDNSLGSGFNYAANDVSSYKSDGKLISFFGRLNYNFKSKYMVTATLRRDGSSKFGKNHKWGLFPSASIAWRINEEEFLSGISWLSNLKLRAGYGVTGNQEAIAYYNSLAWLEGKDKYLADGASNLWKNAMGPGQNSNPDLKWEQTAQTNIGIDFGFFNRINGTVEYYVKNTSDLLYTYKVPQPPYIFPTMLANVGELSNKGFEFSVNTNVLDGKFKWNIDMNFAFNTQKIAKLSNANYTTEDVPEGNLNTLPGQSGVMTQLVKEGYVAGTWYGYRLDSITTTGKWVFHDIDGDGKFSTEKDKEVLGDVQPDYTAGLGMNFSYANVDLSFFFNGIFGQKVFNAMKFYLNDVKRLPNYNVTDDVTSSKITSSPVFSDYFLEDGSFIRLQNVTLGYNLPVKNNWISKARVYASAENLFVITKYSGLDPEINLDGLTSPGIDFGTYPKMRVFSFGLSVGF